MPTIIKDLVDGTSATRDQNGLSVIRAIYIDVSDIPNLTADKKVVEALLVPGIPDYGDQHPSYPSLSVTHINGIPWTQHQIRVTVNYATTTVNLVPDETRPALQNVGTSSQEVETNVDINGNPIRVFYLDPLTGEKAGGPNDVAGGKVGGGTGVGGKIKVYKGLTIVKFKRLELNSPLVKSTQYGATINQSPWMGFSSRTWLCNRIDGDLQPNGLLQMYMVNYEFQYKPEGYKTAAVYVKPDGAFPSLTPADLVSDANGYGNGISYINGFFERDFNQLHLV